METYSDQYERCKITGARPVVRFFPVINKGPEVYMDLTSIHVPGIVENMYTISNYGNVYNKCTNIFLTQSEDKDGYLTVSLAFTDGKYKRRKVHRLLLAVFNYIPDFGSMQVNHIDGNHSNNDLSNIEWGTAKENSNHSMLFGLHKMNGIDNPNNKLSESQVREICELIQTGKYYDTEIAKMYNVSYTNISDIHKGKIWVNISKDYNFGERKPRALCNDQIHEICKMLESGNHSDYEIARNYNVSSQTVMAIRKGQIHKDISSNYNISGKAKPKKFTKDQVREICELIQTGKYYDTEIAKMYNTNPTFLRSLRIGQIHTDITKDYDMTIRKQI